MDDERECIDATELVGNDLEDDPLEEEINLFEEPENKVVVAEYHVVKKTSWFARLAPVLLLAFVAFGVVLYFKGKIDVKNQEIISSAMPEVTERGALAWIDAFTRKEFSVCDLLIESQDSRFYSPLVLTRSVDSRFYQRVLNGIVDCVTDVSLLSVEDGSYKVIVRLKQYEPVAELDVSADVLALRGRFIDGTIGDADFNSGLEDIYYSAFADSCFRLSETEVEFVTVLSEVTVDGIVYVSGTVDFADLILQESGLLSNIVSYENDVKGQVDSVLKSGTD